MHPNPAFRHGDRALLEALVTEIGFGMIVALTPEGPPRPTFKLGRNKPDAERRAVAGGLPAAGSPALAELMLRPVP